MRNAFGYLVRGRDVDDAMLCDDLTGDTISIDSPPPFLEVEEPDEPDLHLLNLATSVFTCLGSSIRAGPRLRCGALQTHWDRRLQFIVYVSLGKGVLIEI